MAVSAASMDEAVSERRETVSHERQAVVLWDCRSPPLEQFVLFRALWSAVRGVALLVGTALKVQRGPERIACDKG